MYENKWKFEEAFKFVKSKRSIICPNSGFISQLLDLEVILCLSTKEEVEAIKKEQRLEEWSGYV